jgi:hypothetical protein
MQNWIEFIGPLADGVFDGLLGLHPFLGRSNIAPKVRKIVNGAPRELMHLDIHVTKPDGNYIPEAKIDDSLARFREGRHDEFLKAARDYAATLDAGHKLDYRKSLSNMFLRWSDVENTVNFDWRFLDTGLVYRFKDEYSYVMFKPLCPAALDALLEVYATSPLPRDIGVTSIGNGELKPIVD